MPAFDRTFTFMHIFSSIYLYIRNKTTDEDFNKFKTFTLGCIISHNFSLKLSLFDVSIATSEIVIKIHKICGISNFKTVPFFFFQYPVRLSNIGNNNFVYGSSKQIAVVS